MKTRTKSEMLIKMEQMNSAYGAMSEEETKRREMALRSIKTCVEIGNKIFCYIPIELLKVDTRMYQRPLQSHFKHLVNNWDDEKCDAITVNYREDGYFYVVDGQHRTEAARVKGISDLVCNTFVGLSLKDEAEMFVGQYDGTKKLDPIDSYRANILCGEKIDTTIQKCCDKYKIIVSRNKAPRVLNSLSVARSIVKPVKTPTGGKTENVEDNVKILDWVFSILSVWEDYKDAYNADMMLALWYIYRNNGNTLETSRKSLVEFFEKSSPKEVKAIGNIEYPDCGHGGGIYRVMMDIISGDTAKLAKAM